ncbi:BMC domain-containing protein [Endozoicomonadaceae bacterium StTr2]
MNKALGLLEFTSIAKGMEAADAMTKVAAIKLEEAKTVCPGKYLVIVSGNLHTVATSVQAGEDKGKQLVVDRLLMTDIHPEVLSGLNGSETFPDVGPVGVLEFFSVASALVATDAAAKAADVKMIDVRLAMAIGGKSYVTMTGDLEQVQTAVDAGESAAREAGMQIGRTVIPAPTEEFFRKLVR